MRGNAGGAGVYRIHAAAALVVAFTPASPCAAVSTVTLTLAPERLGLNAASPYYSTLENTPRSALRSDLEVRWREAGVNGQFTVRRSDRSGESPTTRGILNQLYLDGDLAPGLGYTVGKKVLSSGVGLGFRPLDLIQRENRRAVSPPPPEGVPLLAVQYLNASDAYGVAWSNPGWGAAANDRDDPALSATAYGLRGTWEWHGALRASRRHKLEAGLGWAWTPNEEWAFHAAALYQRRGMTLLNRLAEENGVPFAASDPLAETSRAHVLKAVAGTQWASPAGWGVLLEAWYDGEAMQHDEWRRLGALTARQRALPGIPQAWIDGNLAWSSRLFERPNLLRENLLLRVSYETENWKAHLERLTTPRDGGTVTSFEATRQGDRQRLTAGLRSLSGAADSAYAHSPQSTVAFVEWRYAL